MVSSPAFSVRTPLNIPSWLVWGPDTQTKVWLVFAAAMGGMTSISFLKPLTWSARVLSLVVSGSGALFIAPALVEWLLPHAAANSKVVAAIYYLVTASIMSAFPPFLKWVGNAASDPIAAIKGYLGLKNPQPPENKT